MTEKAFIKTWLIIFALVLIITVIINIAIDPYGLWGSPRLEKLNKIKPAAATRTRLIKPHQLRYFKARTLIMGNSRPELGLDPDSPCWPESYYPIYNQAIPGDGLYRQFRLLQHANSFHKPETIILAIDFIDFLESSPIKTVIWPPKNDTLELNVDSHGNKNPYYPITILQDQLKSTLSLDALLDSFITVLSQSDPYSKNRTTAGFNTAKDYLKIIKYEGQKVLFAQKNVEMEKRLKKKLYLFNNNHWSQSFETYYKLLNYAKKNNINIVAFINPYHKDYLQIIKTTGHHKQFLDWKKKIAQITSEFKKTTLWDFAILNPFTMESITNADNASGLKWFWEPAHYKKEYGELILATIFDNNCLSINLKGSTDPIGLKIQ